jgi:hypothetical protein
LENNPPQLALVQSVSAKPVYVDFATAVDSFKQKKIDILAAPAYGVLPYNLKKSLVNRPKLSIFQSRISQLIL